MNNVRDVSIVLRYTSCVKKKKKKKKKKSYPSGEICSTHRGGRDISRYRKTKEIIAPVFGPVSMRAHSVQKETYGKDIPNTNHAKQTRNRNATIVQDLPETFLGIKISIATSIRPAHGDI